MRYFKNETETEIVGLKGFDLQRTFECGQCFRWNDDGTGAYIGVAMGKRRAYQKGRRPRLHHRDAGRC